MNKDFYKYIEDNLTLFNLWIETHARLQISSDILQPLIQPFKEENPTINLNGCQDCIIDMLIWAKIKLKNKNNGKKGNTKE